MTFYVKKLVYPVVPAQPCMMLNVRRQAAYKKKEVVIKLTGIKKVEQSAGDVLLLSDC